MNLTFDPELHRYTINGRAVPSVTQVLADMGLYSDEWITNIRRSRARGTAGHQICDLIDYGRGGTWEEIIASSHWDPDTTAPVLVPYGFGYAKFLADTGFEAVYSEHAVGSEAYMVAGMLDKWGQCRGKRWLVDVKTGQPSPSSVLQVGIYQALLKETENVETTERIVVHLMADGKYKIVYQSSGMRDVQLGLAAVSLWWFRFNNKLLRGKEI